MSPLRLAASDFLVSFVWVCSGAILRYLAYVVIGKGMDPVSLLVKGSLAVVYLYSFALIGKATEGGSYNPLMVLCYAIFGNFQEFVFAVFGRIPSQVIGSIVGVWLINVMAPATANGPRLSVDAHHGALTEGLLTYMIVVISLGLKKLSTSSSTRIWISSAAKVILHILASDMTGGIMNPAAAFAWAYAQGEHLTREHLCVYWLAPVEGTLLGVWTCSLFIVPQRHDQLHLRDKNYKID